MIHTHQAEQAHAVPSRAYAARGLFDPAITHRDRPVQPDELVDEMGLPLAPPGATAQNGFQEVRYLQCNLCGEVMPEADTPHHAC